MPKKIKRDEQYWMHIEFDAIFYMQFAGIRVEHIPYVFTQTHSRKKATNENLSGP